MESLFNSELFKWIILPFMIFTARILDVTLGTMRIVFVSKGMRYLAAVVGFIEVIIWLLAIRVIMQNLDNFLCYIAYGAGFAMGNIIGISLEKRLAVGRAVLRIITHKDASQLIESLRNAGCGVTSLDAQGSSGKVNVIFLVIRRSDFAKVTSLIHRYNPNAFYTLEDVRFVSEGIFPKSITFPYSSPLGLFKYFRKGK